MPISTETTRRMRALIDALKDISKQADELQIRNADMATEISKLRKHIRSVEELPESY